MVSFIKIFRAELVKVIVFLAIYLLILLYSAAESHSGLAGIFKIF